MLNTQESLNRVSDELAQSEKAKVSTAAPTPIISEAITDQDTQTTGRHYNQYNTSASILTSLNDSYPDAPDDLLEWVASDLGSSAIAPEIALDNFTPVWDKKAIAQILAWKVYKGEFGWASGNLELLERQFKPINPIVGKDGKDAKYLTSKEGYDAALLKGIDWDAIANDPTET